MSQTAAKTATDLANIPAGKLIHRMAERFGVDENKLVSTLKQTAFKIKPSNDGPKEASNEQMMALMVVADQYELNPFTREIFAFPDKQNGIVPVVSVDGWSRIINSHQNFDGLEFRYSETIAQLTYTNKVKKEVVIKCPEWCEIVIYRKDRSRPTVIREYLDEVYRDVIDGQYGPIIGPWQTHTKRMLRHKTLIQGGRIAFGFGGIYDEDEAGRIIEGEVVRQLAGDPVHNEVDAIVAGQHADVDHDKRASVIADLSAKADEGVEALDATWAAMTEETRELVGLDNFDRIKKLAETKAATPKA